MTDRATGGLVPMVRDGLSIGQAVVSLERCGLARTFLLNIPGKADFSLWMIYDSLRTPPSAFPL